MSSERVRGWRKASVYVMGHRVTATKREDREGEKPGYIKRAGLPNRREGKRFGMMFLGQVVTVCIHKLLTEMNEVCVLGGIPPSPSDKAYPRLSARTALHFP